MLKSGIYFSLSTLITWWFIVQSPLYTSLQQQLLSCGIAGAKWGIQIVAALLWLGPNKWTFIKNIGRACLWGSVLLLPYAGASFLWGANGPYFFVGSLVLSVATMIVLYAIGTKHAGAKMGWWLFWLLCLAVAVTLQLTVVFPVL
jgi:hypothetical protein